MNRKINDFTELESDYDVVFNCTGMGSKYLCDDRHMVPIRGQLIKVIFWKLTTFAILRIEKLRSE